MSINKHIHVSRQLAQVDFMALTATRHVVNVRLVCHVTMLLGCVPMAVLLVTMATCVIQVRCFSMYKRSQYASIPIETFMFLHNNVVDLLNACYNNKICC